MIFSIPRKKPFVKEKILPESSLPPPGPLAIPPLICYNFIQSRNQRKGRYRGQRAVFLAFCAEPDRVAIIMAKVAVRRINEWDGPSMLKIYAPYVGTPLAPEDALPELQDYIRRIDTYTYGLGWLLCEIDSTPAGFCHLTENRHDPENLFSVEFQLYVKAEYQRMGVGFDKIYYESDTYLEGKELVLKGLEEGIMERHDDGSVWADLTADGLDNKLLLRADGTSVYMTQDIGTAKLRYRDYPIDKMIYVVGNEQNYHFQVLSILLDRLGFKWGKDLVHFSYGMVNLPNGRMKSREGTVVDADDLMADMVADAKKVIEERGEIKKLDGATPEEVDTIAETVGMGALKYFLLKVDPRKNMTFNPEESIDFNGNTGPFIQYTYARIRSVLRKAAESGVATADYSAVKPGEREIALIQRLADFSSTVSEAGRTYSPALIANYAYDLVKEYNQFYHDCTILGETDPAVRSLRLALSATTARTVKTALGLLGINVPERM